MTVFVTGGSGFVGRRVLAHLRSRHPLRVLVRDRSKIENAADLEIIEGDLADASTYAHAMAGVTTVVHLAAQTGKAAPKVYRAANVEAVERLLDACERAGVRNFLHVSSVAAAFDRLERYPYGLSKRDAEDRVRASKLAFTILRPTIVLGEGSPIWNTVFRIAGLPIIPLPEGRERVSIQPVDVEDVARAVASVLELSAFHGETLDVGGPDRVTMREFLDAVRRSRTGRAAKFLPAPAGLLQPMLAAVEPVARPVMPLTAGQLTLFTSNAVADDNWLTQHLAPMTPLRLLIDRLCAPGPKGGSNASVKLTTQLSEHDARRLDAECATFTKYLSGAAPDAAVLRHYRKALAARGLLDESDAFERLALRVARRGGFWLRCADAYCGLFARRSLLRRRLILLFAVLENSAGVHRRFAPKPTANTLDAISKLAGNGFAAAVWLAGGASVLLLPHLFLRTWPPAVERR